MKKTAIYQRKRPGSSRWLNKWVQSPRWFGGFAGSVVLSLLAFAWSSATSGTDPSSTWGLAYGIAAAGLLLAVLLYAVRRRTLRFRRLGRSWIYLQVHVYGGTLFLLLVLMHSGFTLPHGVLTWWLLLLSIWVVGSGLLGIAIQKWIPSVLQAGFPVEIHYDRVPELVDEIRTRAGKLADQAGERVQAFYTENLATALEAPAPRLMYFLDVTGGMRTRVRSFESLRTLLAPDEREVLDDLQRLYRSKLEIDAHFTLQKALRGWLVLHVPASVVLVALVVVHILTVVYY